MPIKKKPRVLIDAFHLLNALTGIRTYTLQLCEGIEGFDNNDIDYIIYPNWKKIDRINFLRGNVGFIKKIINHALYFIWKQCALPGIIFFKRIDVLVTPDYLLPYLQFGAKSVSVFHDTFYWELTVNYNPLWRKYFLYSVKKGLKKDTMVLTDTNFSKSKIQSIITNDHKIEVVYPSPARLNLNKENINIFEVLELPKEAKFFLHVGVFDKRKNIELLVRAFSKFRKLHYDADYYLILVGSSGVSLFHDSTKSVRELIRIERLEDKVLLPGFVSNEVLSSLYSNAFAYVFPSREEGFGIPVIEAMKAQIPIIISNQGALVEVAGDAALIFNMDNDEELVEKMSEITDFTVRDKLIKKGRIRIKLFSQENFVSNFNSKIIEYIKN